MKSIDLNCDMGERHGALYNMSAMDEALSDAIALAAQDIPLAAS